MYSASETAFSVRSDLKPITKRSQHALHDDQIPELDIMTIAYKYFLDEFAQLTDDERRHRLFNLDALEMLQTIEMVQKDLAIFKLENHIMVDFLEKNDPKLLVGLRHRRTSILKKFRTKGNYNKTIYSIRVVIPARSVPYPCPSIWPAAWEVKDVNLLNISSITKPRPN